jgi:PAS domain S-box-containing protein
MQPTAEADAVAIIVADSGGTIRQWSPGASRLFGHLAEDVLGASLDVIVPERYRQAHWAAFTTVMAGGPGTLDGACVHIPVRCHDGQVRVFPTRFSFVRDPYGQVIAAMATCADHRGEGEPFSPVEAGGDHSDSG